MTYRSRLVLAVGCLVTGTVVAQPSAEDARAAAYREAERFTNCWTRVDVDCVEELTHRELLEAADLYGEEIKRLRSAVLSHDRKPRGVDLDVLVDIQIKEVAEPWPPFSVDGRMFTLVPYLEFIGSTAGNDLLSMDVADRLERTGFLIGASEDDGESWRFVVVSSNSPLRPDEIDLVIPGYGEGPRPEVMTIEVWDTPFERSRWLETRERQFVLAGDAFLYSLAVDIREGLEGPIDLVVRYDDPADPDRPLEYRDSLAAGQREFRWQSPTLVGFEMGSIYNVVIEGSDPDTGDRLFEHRQGILYHPTAELWWAVMSKPPPVDPPAWAEGCIVSTDVSARPASDSNTRLVGHSRQYDPAGPPVRGVIDCGGDLPLGR